MYGNWKIARLILSRGLLISRTTSICQLHSLPTKGMKSSLLFSQPSSWNTTMVQKRRRLNWLTYRLLLHLKSPTPKSCNLEQESHLKQHKEVLTELKRLFTSLFQGVFKNQLYNRNSTGIIQNAFGCSSELSTKTVSSSSSSSSSSSLMLELSRSSQGKVPNLNLQMAWRDLPDDSGSVVDLNVRATVPEPPLQSHHSFFSSMVLPCRTHPIQ